MSEHSGALWTSGSRLGDRAVDQRSQLTTHRVRGRLQQLGKEKRNQVLVWVVAAPPQNKIAGATRNQRIHMRDGGSKRKVCRYRVYRGEGVAQSADISYASNEGQSEVVRNGMGCTHGLVQR